MRIWLLLLLISFEASAYQSSVNAGGKSLTWPNSSMLLSIQSSNDDLVSGTASSIIQQSVTEWNTHSALQIIPTNSAANVISFKDDFSTHWGDDLESNPSRASQFPEIDLIHINTPRIKKDARHERIVHEEPRFNFHKC